MSDILYDSISTRASLVERLKNWDDHDSWRDFKNTYWRLIFETARKAGLNEEEAKDVAQETLKRVAEKIRTFFYDPAIGSFKGWLYRLTRQNISVQYEKRLPRASSPAEPDADARVLEAMADPAAQAVPEDVWEEEWRKNLLNAAMLRLKQRVPPRQLQIFDLYETQNWPVKKVAETLGVSAAMVYVTGHRVRRMLKQEVARLQQELI